MAKSRDLADSADVINFLDNLSADVNSGLTTKLSTTSNLSDLTDADAALVNIGLTATATELNYVDGVTSNIQTQLGTKLASASYTASDVLTKVKTVDGAASGLDADLLDGQHGSYYTDYTDTAISNLVDSAPGALDTLNELAAALGDDANFSTTVTNSIALKAPLASPTFTGTVTADGLSLSDNDKATFGAGDDLEIYHDGSHSFISDQGTGSLRLLAQNFVLANPTNTEAMLVAFPNGSVDLYYDNAEKLTTTSTGINVTGTVTADGLSISKNGTDHIAVIDTSSGQVTNLSTGNTVGYISVDPSNTVADSKFAVYVDGNEYLEVNPTGIDVTGTVTADGLSLGDNEKAIFGTGNDLSIYHNGAQSIIEDQGTGGLLIKGSTNLQLRSSADEVYINCVENAQVSLKYNNNTKLDTTATGIDVTGTVTMDGLTVADNTPIITIEDTDGATTGFFSATGSTVRFGASTSDAVQFYSNNTIRQNISSGGDISFYEDTGTTAKFFWDASAESLGIGTSSPTANAGLHIQGSDGASGSSVNVAANEFFIDNNGNTGMTLGSSNTGSGGYAFADSDVALRAGMFYVHSTDQMNFRVASQTRVSIDSTGNVGIGTTSPSSYHAVADNLVIGTTSGSNGLTIVAGTADDGSIHFADGTSGADAYRGQIYYSHAGNYMVFGTNASEAMRIDSSGNLLVGTTAESTWTSTEGAAIRENGTATFTRDGNVPFYANRLTSDGDIARFSKDGTTVGSIAYSSGNFRLDGDGLGLHLNGSSNVIYPSNGSGSLNDGAVNLGISTSRFKNAHFSGTVNANAFVGDGSGLTGVGGGAWELVSSVTASSSSYLTFTGLGSTYLQYMFVFENLKMGSSSRKFLFEVSDNNGSSYINTSVFYDSKGIIGQTSTPSGSRNETSTGMYLTTQDLPASSSGYIGLSGQMNLFTAGGSNSQIAFTAHLAYSNTGGSPLNQLTGGATLGNASAINALRFFSENSGTVASGKIYLYGLKRT